MLIGGLFTILILAASISQAQLKVKVNFAKGKPERLFNGVIRGSK